VHGSAFAADRHPYKEDHDAGTDTPQEIVFKDQRVKKGREAIR
jgi:hypothetical protein